MSDKLQLSEAVFNQAIREAVEAGRQGNKEWVAGQFERLLKANADQPAIVVHTIQKCRDYIVGSK